MTSGDAVSLPSLRAVSGAWRQLLRATFLSARTLSRLPEARCSTLCMTVAAAKSAEALWSLTAAALTNRYAAPTPLTGHLTATVPQAYFSAMRRRAPSRILTACSVWNITTITASCPVFPRLPTRWVSLRSTAVPTGVTYRAAFSRPRGTAQAVSGV